MKKFKRKTPLLSLSKMAVAALCLMIAAVLIFIFAGTDNKWSVICGGFAASLFGGDLFAILGVGGKYRYSDKYIEVFYLCALYKKLDYLSFSAIVISNASYNNGYGYGIDGNIPMQYKVKGINGNFKVTFPFISLHKTQYPLDKIKKGMNSRDLFILDSDEKCQTALYISNKHLPKHKQDNRYALTILLKNQTSKCLNSITFSIYKENSDRFYIITDRLIQKWY